MMHAELANGRWFTLTFAEQMANIGSEVHRLISWRNRDEIRFNSTFDRALELIDLTLSDPRWRRGYVDIKKSHVCAKCFVIFTSARTNITLHWKRLMHISLGLH